MPDTWCYYASDQLAEGGFRDRDKEAEKTAGMPVERMRFFDGFHRSIPAFAAAGNNLIVEHIIEFELWLTDLRVLLKGYDVFMVGVHCPPEELQRREKLRGDRAPGEALHHLRTHGFCRYDLEIDGRERAEANAARIVTAWQERKAPGALFENS